jgi:hypothetical protein
MRQGQQNRRGRGRNRKGQSPLTRSFESTGPDVKIRGTPSHIAEKYMSLARDATSSGDPVLAENYLQHAEHYNRIIMAFRDQQISQGGGDMNGGMPRNRPFGNDMEGDDYSDDDGDDGEMQPPVRHHEQQPRYEGQRGGHEQQGRFRDRDRNDHRNNRNQDRDRNDRGGRHEQPRVPAEAVEGGGQQPSVDAPFQPRRERFSQQPHEQPEFLRRPVRRPRRDTNGSNGAAPEANGAVADEGERD